MKLFSNIRYLSIYKIKNLIRLKSYYNKLKRIYGDSNKLEVKLSESQTPPPSFLSFEPTNYCNLKCPACPSGSGVLTRPKGYADFDLFKKVVDENKKHLINLVLHFQGEPLLNSDLPKMIEYARKNKVRTELSTNANLPTETITRIINSKPDKLIISLDGLSQETYNLYRINGEMSRVLQTLETISNFPKKERPLIELQFLVFRHNEHEITEIKNIKRKYKIDITVIKSAQIYGKDQIDLIPENLKYSRYIIDEDGNPNLKKPIHNRCKRIIFGSVITWDGKLVPCCFDKNAEFILSDVNKTPINEIRNENAYKEFIKNVFSQRNMIEMCRNCTEG